MSDEITPLSGEARIDAIVLHLQNRHGISFPPEVLASAPEDKEAEAVEEKYQE